ncbi:MAG TPA: NAD(P)H-dependent glycerol-3-phosphate dehydrogenase [Gemmatales bacterium]|nr:NAD(P)H-dependent glycerol-3-phosphate dehydrogenase [Gemmatales bacterium]
MIPQKLTVLGDGAMGTACALLAHARGVPRVCLWSALPENGQLLQQHRENLILLPGVKIPENIQLTMEVEEAVDEAELLLLAIPTVYIRSTLARFSPVLKGNAVPMVSVAKGLEMETFLRPTEIMAELLGPRSLAVLSGPCHAEEVTRGKPTGLVVASNDANLAQTVQNCLHGGAVRIYTGSDMIGVELAAALKNVIGIAAGISDGLEYGDNAKSALLSRALVEMTEFGIKHGAEAATFFGLAGLGDLITTCISPHGRNRTLGYRLGKGEKLEAIVRSTRKVAEGVFTAKSVHQRCQSQNLEMPICRAVYQVLYEEQPPREAVRELLAREPKSELPWNVV